MNSKESFSLIYLTMDNNDPKDAKVNEWYDRVYLCFEDIDNKETTHLPIKGFKCYRFNSFSSADYGWKICNNNISKLEVRHTMIPMCKWVPEIFDKFILNWKLKNIYWLGKNSFGRGYNKYSISDDTYKFNKDYKEKQLNNKNHSDDKK
jgi:hypothetical protein